MSELAVGIRQRGPRKRSPSRDAGLVSGAEDELPEVPRTNKVAAYIRPTGFPRRYKVALVVLTALAFVTRFWNIGHPNEVVFDEVHFGKVCWPVNSWTLPVRLLTDVVVRVIRKFPVRLSRTELHADRSNAVSGTNVLLRCPPSVRQAPVRPHGLARWLRWSLQVRQHRRFLHRQRGSLCRISCYAGDVGVFDRVRGVPHHAGMRLQLACRGHCCSPSPLWYYSPFVATPTTADGR